MATKPRPTTIESLSLFVSRRKLSSKDVAKALGLIPRQGRYRVNALKEQNYIVRLEGTPYYQITPTGQALYEKHGDMAEAAPKPRTGTNPFEWRTYAGWSAA